MQAIFNIMFSIFFLVSFQVDCMALGVSGSSSARHALCGCCGHSTRCCFGNVGHWAQQWKHMGKVGDKVVQKFPNCKRPAALGFMDRCEVATLGFGLPIVLWNKGFKCLGLLFCPRSAAEGELIKAPAITPRSRQDLVERRGLLQPWRRVILGNSASGRAVLGSWVPR